MGSGILMGLRKEKRSEIGSSLKLTTKMSMLTGMVMWIGTKLEYKCTLLLAIGLDEWSGRRIGIGLNLKYTMKMGTLMRIVGRIGMRMKKSLVLV